MVKLTDVIIQIASKNERFTTNDVADKLHISRQAANTHIRRLVKERVLVKRGHTIGSYYMSAQKASCQTSKKVRQRFLREGVEEHKIFTNLRDHTPFLRDLSDNVSSVLFYAFSEMLNNAIEHSQSKWIEVEISKDADHLDFVITDFGIGVFRNVMRSRHLLSEIEAIQDIVKGKTTTAPHSHSGEGIFFTSKVADVFMLDSYGYRLRVDTLIDDVFIEKIQSMNRGTRVHFRIALDSTRHLNDVFRQFVVNQDEPGFNKTEIKVRLFVVGSIYISRSQARRILTGLEKYESIVFDFDKVTTVGQAFADEIFRVFHEAHPDIQLEAINMVEPVQFMVERAKERN